MAESSQKKKADSSFTIWMRKLNAALVHRGLKGATWRLSQAVSFDKPYVWIE